MNKIDLKPITEEEFEKSKPENVKIINISYCVSTGFWDTEEKCLGIGDDDIVYIWRTAKLVGFWSGFSEACYWYRLD